MRWAVFPAVALLLSCEALPRGTALAPDADREGQEAVDLLRELIRFDTINPPQPGSGKAHVDETALLRHVKSVLAADGIPSEIFESAPGRGNLVARLKGSGAKRPVLLMAHVDVVNVDRSQWEVDPMSGALKDGFIWGRGALDDKDDAAVFTQLLRVQKRSGKTLSRDLILMLNADEESSGHFGARWMAEHHWDQIECEFVLSEGGSSLLGDGGVAQYGFETAEKVYNDFRLFIPGESGHSSVPVQRNAVYDAGRLLAKIESYQTPIRLIETTRASLEGLATAPRGVAWGQEFLKKAAEGDVEAATRLAQNPRFNAQLRSTFVPTMVKGGIRENVLPPDVEINFNARLLPGDSIDELIRGVMAHAGIATYQLVEGGEAEVEKWKRERKGPDVAVFLVDRGVDAPASPLDTDLYRALVVTARRISPAAVVIPRMSTGATDLRFFRLRGVPCYGISPCPVGEVEESTPHHHNERVRVDSVKMGLRFVKELAAEIGR
ncbi:MAG TPA: M20/M25/M40 family metallo-hydrolase [Planctomycetota bacterium]|nr:M20/M25/M40 family metallo-hydrolase [Planctomycetota bacterium]